jgi:enhancing lycopene biosynthesis protein 2
MDKELLKQLANKLQRGDLGKIAKAAKVSPATVLFWLRGEAHPKRESEIIEAARIVLEQRKERTNKNNEELKALLNQL